MHINFNFFLKSIYQILIISSLISCMNNNNNNPLLEDWKGNYDGTPNFDLLKVEYIEEAMLKGIESHLNDIEKITSNSNPPTFENTIKLYESSGELLNKVYPYYGILKYNLSSEEFRDIESRLAPLITDYSTQIRQNEVLFKKIKSVYNQSKINTLDSVKQRLVELIYKSFKMNGADLDKEAKKRYAEINLRLSTLYTDFSNNLLNDEQNFTTYLNENELSGLSNDFIKAIKAKAITDNKPENYAIPNTRSFMDPFLTFSSNRELRKIVWTNYYSRGNNDNEFDNKLIIKEILKLRKERVILLGFSDFGSWRLQDRMAKTPENALKLLESVWPYAIKRVKEEVIDMQKIADKDKIIIEPWDYRYYAEKVRQKKYNLDSDEVKQYLQLDRLRDAMFYVAERVFNYKFTPTEPGEIAVFHKDVNVWKVEDINTKKLIGLWYLDPYAREGKRSGAWATTYRSYTSFNGEKSILGSNNSNFIKPAKGESSLVSWDDATTLFHEFGHALNYFASKSVYPTLNGGVRDYIEFQSQLLERWLSTDEVINKFLIHHKTQKSIPEELVQKLKNASKFNQGFSTTEYLASALIDLKIHQADPETIDIEKFEAETLKSLNMPDEIVMRHRTTQFAHVFSSEGYATAYYGYIWAEVLSADATEMFTSSPGGFYDKELSKKLVNYLFTPQNSIDPEKAYILFRGKKANPRALMRSRGFID